MTEKCGYRKTDHLNWFSLNPVMWLYQVEYDLPLNYKEIKLFSRNKLYQTQNVICI